MNVFRAREVIGELFYNQNVFTASDLVAGAESEILKIGIRYREEIQMVVGIEDEVEIIDLVGEMRKRVVFLVIKKLKESRLDIEKVREIKI